MPKIKPTIKGGFDTTELEQDVNYLNLASDLNNEIGIHREFIKHFNKNTAKEYLIAISQYKHFSNVWHNNLCKVDANSQIKLSKLHKELFLAEQLQLAEIIRILTQSLQ